MGTPPSASTVGRSATSGPGYTRLASAKPLGPLSMLVSDSGRLAANSGAGVPGMSPGLLYVNVMPSPAESMWNPPNWDARSPLSLDCAWAEPLAPTAATKATPTSAISALLRRRTDDHLSWRCVAGRRGASGRRDRYLGL